MLKILLFNFIFFYISSAYTSDWNTYQRITNTISKRFCINNAEKHFIHLYKKYKGLGFYIPTNKNNKPNYKIIKDSYHLFNQKIDWIGSQKKNVTKKKNFLKELFLLKRFSMRLNDLIRLKYREKIKSREKFLYTWVIFKNDFRYFIYNNVSFLLPFGYPIDYKKLRQDYEFYKIKFGKNNFNTKKQYFLRKIYEDGSQRINHSYNDRFQRALLNTLLNRMKVDSSLTNSTRVDLEDFLKYAYKILLKGKKHTIIKLDEWEARINKQKLFYSKVLIDDSINKYITAQQNYTKELKTFVLRKEANIFSFISSYKLKWRKLFVLESILTHEVGGLRNLNEDKLDIAQVVINRSKLSKYNLISKKDDLHKYLDLGYEKYHFLNTLFKEGEFSFTYFFIPSVVRLFCPDQSLRGKRFRKKNFLLAKKILLNPTSFNGRRYFSRVSILGRYKMDDIWTDYKRIKAQSGNVLPKILQKKYKRLLKKNKLQKIYSLKINSNQYILYRSLKKKKNILYRFIDKKFYNYRDQDYFSYFELISKQ